MQAGGDWTRAVHNAVKKRTVRPAYICGPFASPYGTAINFDNLICVASGIGITPALSVVTSFKGDRRINLVWMCRDPSLVEFFLENTVFDDRAYTLIYYTGHRPLVINSALHPCVFVLRGRPDLCSLLPSIILSIEEETGLPEDIVRNAEAYTRSVLECPIVDHFKNQLTRLLKIYDATDIFQMAVEHGRENSTSKGETPRAKLGELKQRAEEHVDRLSDPQVLDQLTAYFEENQPDMVPIVLQMPASTRRAYLVTTFKPEVHSAFHRNKDTRRRGQADGESKQLLSDRGSHIGGQRSLELRHSLELQKSSERGFASLEGLTITMNELCGTMYRPSELQELFDTIDSDNSGLVSEAEFNKFVTAVAVRGGGDNTQLASGCSEEKLTQLAQDFNCAERSMTWQVMYCGGVQVVVDTLESVCTNYSLGFAVEKFDW